MQNRKGLPETPGLHYSFENIEGDLSSIQFSLQRPRITASIEALFAEPFNFTLPQRDSSAKQPLLSQVSTVTALPVESSSQLAARHFQKDLQKDCPEISQKHPDSIKTIQEDNAQAAELLKKGLGIQSKPTSASICAPAQSDEHISANPIFVSPEYEYELIRRFVPPKTHLRTENYQNPLLLQTCSSKKTNDSQAPKDLFKNPAKKKSSRSSNGVKFKSPQIHSSGSQSRAKGLQKLDLAPENNRTKQVLTKMNKVVLEHFRHKMKSEQSLSRWGDPRLFHRTKSSLYRTVNLKSGKETDQNGSPPRDDAESSYFGPAESQHKRTRFFAVTTRLQTIQSRIEGREVSEKEQNTKKAKMPRINDDTKKTHIGTKKSAASPSGRSRVKLVSVTERSKHKATTQKYPPCPKKPHEPK